MKKYYRVLIEVDEYGETIPSVAVLDISNNTLVGWFNDTDEAIEWVKNNGYLATLN
jgi:hypothetical protein